MGRGTAGNQEMPASTRGKLDMYFGFGFLLKDAERGLREAGMNIKLSGGSVGKNQKQTKNTKNQNTNHSRVIIVFDNCRTLGRAMFPITFGLMGVCPLILITGRHMF